MCLDGHKGFFGVAEFLLNQTQDYSALAEVLVSLLGSRNKEIYSDVIRYLGWVGEVQILMDTLVFDFSCNDFTNPLSYNTSPSNTNPSGSGHQSAKLHPSVLSPESTPW